MAATDFFYGVDGTGDGDNDVYRADFANSHIRRMYQGWQGRSYYNRGPTNSGFSTDEKAAQVVLRATEFWKTAQNLRSPMGTRIFLGGYSRGAAAVVEAAYLLGKKDIPVHALLIFDAVDRATGIQNSDTIPSNVTFCYHARRDPAAGSREFFGNTAYNYERKWTFYQQKFFHGSHGAIGGTPWKTFNRRDEVQELTDAQMAAGIIAAGRNTELRRQVILNTYTNVTREQEVAASAASGSWMTLRLEEAKRVAAAIVVTARRTAGASGSW